MCQKYTPLIDISTEMTNADATRCLFFFHSNPKKQLNYEENQIKLFILGSYILQHIMCSFFLVS